MNIYFLIIHTRKEKTRTDHLSQCNGKGCKIVVKLNQEIGFMQLETKNIMLRGLIKQEIIFLRDLLS